MTGERQKMLAGELYDADDPDLVAARLRTRALGQRLNTLPGGPTEELDSLLTALFGRSVRATITPPFHCDYGSHIDLGDGVYFNFGCVVLDPARVRIGARTLLGPGVHVVAASHPMSAEVRRRGLELALPVTIGSDVWIGGGAIVCPGVEIGDGSVIGAGSVVTRSVPSGVFAAGNPCRTLRRLP